MKAQMISLGADNEFQFVSGREDGWPELYPEMSSADEDGTKLVVIGILEWHHRPHTKIECGGFVRFVRANGDKVSPVWEVHCLEPLDLAPSLLCKCGNHGFIHEGRWESV